MVNSTDRTLHFKGNELQYRNIPQDYRKRPQKYGSYNDNKLIDAQNRNDTPLSGIKLCHFGTRPPIKYSRYGDCMFKIPYDVMIKRYLQARLKGKDGYTSVVYRVACTQVYYREINRIIMVGCDDDNELDMFPVAIDGLKSQTKYFKIIPTEAGSIVKMLRYHYENGRHENLTLSFYLPDNCLLSLSQEDYTKLRVQHNPEWCHEMFKGFDLKGQCPSNKQK